MGMFAKLKSVGKMLSGSSAQVYVEVPEVSLNTPFPVRVKACVSDADLTINSVYLLVRAVEEVRIDGERVENKLRELVDDPNADFRVGDIVNSETTCDLRVNISGSAQLEANQEYEWEGEVSLPPGSAPSFQGHNCHHVWQIQAGLDARGNDPDSGWVDFCVYE